MPTIRENSTDDDIVVASDDVVLVAPPRKSDAVKALVAAINGKPEALIGDRARHYRP